MAEEERKYQNPDSGINWNLIGTVIFVTLIVLIILKVLGFPYLDFIYMGIIGIVILVLMSISKTFSKFAALVVFTLIGSSGALLAVGYLTEYASKKGWVPFLVHYWEIAPNADGLMPLFTLVAAVAISLVLEKYLSREWTLPLTTFANAALWSSSGFWLLGAKTVFALLLVLWIAKKLVEALSQWNRRVLIITTLLSAAVVAGYLYGPVLLAILSHSSNMAQHVALVTGVVSGGIFLYRKIYQNMPDFLR